MKFVCKGTPARVSEMRACSLFYKIGGNIVIGVASKASGEIVDPGQRSMPCQPMYMNVINVIKSVLLLNLTKERLVVILLCAESRPISVVYTNRSKQYINR